MNQPAPFMEGRYIVALVGTTNGVVECANFGALRATLEDMYPNPGDQTLAYLLTPSNWVVAADDMPFNVESLVVDNDEDYRISIFRVMELES
jgi:hypothetical protein